MKRGRGPLNRGFHSGRGFDHGSYKGSGQASVKSNPNVRGIQGP